MLAAGCAKPTSVGPLRSRTGCSARRSVLKRSVRAEAADSCNLDWERVDAPSPEKRKLLNALVLGAVSLPTAQAAYTYLSVLVPVREGGAGGAQPARDALGDTVMALEWLAKHPNGDRSLVQGLQGDATYLIVTDDGGLQNYGLNSICTHLGCVVPWNAAENKFICPCHGSQYNAQGMKTRGPAPLSLALVHSDVAESGAVELSPWTDTDFRTGEKPWWA